MRILQTGQFWHGSDCLHIARAWEAEGAIVRRVPDETLFPDWRGRALRGVRRVLRPALRRAWNARLLAEARLFQPDVVFIANAHECAPQTVRALRTDGRRVMCFYHDAELYAHSRFLACVSEFDLVASPCWWHKERFEEVGAQAVMQVRYGYDPEAHQPVRLGERERAIYSADIVFVGSHWLPRAEAFAALIGRDFAHRLTLWGGRWGLLPTGSPLRACWRGREIHDGELRYVYGGAKAAIQWVKVGDQHNPRTFQIAACGGAILVAQRTEEHQAFFREDVEAVFFEGVEELRDKLNFWLRDDQEAARERMAAAARERCLAEDYGYRPVVRRYAAFFAGG